VPNPYPAQRSCFLKPTGAPGGRLDVQTSTGSAANAVAEHFARLFYAHVTGPVFPCTLGRAAYKNLAFRVSVFNDLTDSADLDALCHDLWEFVQVRKTLAPHKAGVYSTYAALFVTPPTNTELEFEDLLWPALQHVHDADVDPWDSTTESDPADPRFSFSFAGCSFFLVGLHPTSSRKSRQFPAAVLTFNAHDQFEDLRRNNRFDAAQKAIRARDTLIQGDINPSLTTYGQDSEAKQYSGRLVPQTWVCPFKPKP
jgi:uncharacterized protein